MEKKMNDKVLERLADELIDSLITDDRFAKMMAIKMWKPFLNNPNEMCHIQELANVAFDLGMEPGHVYE